MTIAIISIALGVFLIAYGVTTGVLEIEKRCYEKIICE
jgi:hypothetical protein